MGYNMGSKSSKSKNVEQEVFKVLEHQTRRNILKFIGEKKNPTFTDIIDAVKIADSPTLSYHLRTLAPFVERQNGSYQLTPIGQDAYSLLLKTAEYSKLVFHMGMTMTEEEHQKWHDEHPEMTPELHSAFMKKMGISEEEDKKWHMEHGEPPKHPSTTEKKTVNPFAIGGGFLNYCVKQGWLIQEGKGRNAKYYVTKEGEGKLGEFGIII